jgi:hypothetical protein
MQTVKHREGDIGNGKCKQRFDNYLSHWGGSISSCILD